MGGSKENRHTPGLEHWSIAVQEGKALEDKWRSEIPIPRGGPHRFGSLLFGSFPRFMVILALFYRVDCSIDALSNYMRFNLLTGLVL